MKDNRVKAANGIGPGSSPGVRVAIEARALRNSRKRARERQRIARLEYLAYGLHESHVANERRAHGGAP